jgi:hypothetical protein
MVGRKVMRISVMNNRSGVGAVVSNSVMSDCLFVLLCEWLEMKIAMLVVTGERLMVELVVLTEATIAMDDWVVVGGRAVVDFGDSLMRRLLVNGPAVHGRTVIFVNSRCNRGCDDGGSLNDCGNRSRNSKAVAGMIEDNGVGSSVSMVDNNLGSGDAVSVVDNSGGTVAVIKNSRASDSISVVDNGGGTVAVIKNSGASNTIAVIDNSSGTVAMVNNSRASDTIAMINSVSMIDNSW